MTKLLHLYEQELSSLRHHAVQFAREFPEVAGRLGVVGLAETGGDPDVERLMEGFAFLAARIRLELAEQPARLARHLLEMIYPDYLAPTPSMAVVQIRPFAAGSPELMSGARVARQSSLRSQADLPGSVACEYRTAHDVTLWPLDIASARYGADAAMWSARVADTPRIRAGVSLVLTTQGGVSFDTLSLDALPLFIHAQHGSAMRLYEQLVAHCIGIVVQPKQERASWKEPINPSNLTPLGFEDEQALLPCGPRTSQGHRLLREYFALPERFLFLELRGLQPAVSRCIGTELEVAFLLDVFDDQLPGVVNRDTFRLFCTPAVNLFPKLAEPITISNLQTEYRIVPDRSRQRDYEVHSVSNVTRRDREAESSQDLLPLYSAFGSREPGGYFAVQRRARPLSREERTQGTRSGYQREDVFLSLADANLASHGPRVQSLSVVTLCTNADLPLLIPFGRGQTDFHVDDAPEAVDSVRVLAGPTPPWRSPGADENVWPLIKHLSLNQLSIAGGNTDEDGSTLRELLALHSRPDHMASRIQINAIRAVSSRPVAYRMHRLHPMALVRGLQVAVTFDDEAEGAFLLAAVLERIFAKYVSINSFSQTMLWTRARGEVMRWPPRTGTRPNL